MAPGMLLLVIGGPWLAFIVWMLLDHRATMQRWRQERLQRERAWQERWGDYLARYKSPAQREGA